MKHDMEDKVLPKDYYSGLAHRVLSLTHGTLPIQDHTDYFHLLDARVRMVETPRLRRYIRGFQKPIQCILDLQM